MLVLLTLVQFVLPLALCVLHGRSMWINACRISGARRYRKAWGALCQAMKSVIRDSLFDTDPVYEMVQERKREETN